MNNQEGVSPFPEPAVLSRDTMNSDNTAGQTLRNNIDVIRRLEEESVKALSPVEHLADRITAIAGSTPFIIFHIIWFTTWITINTNLIPGIHSFDPYPFNFLTLVVSLEAIFLTLLVLMSQNSMTKTADKRAHLDLQINMLDEQESTRILKMVQKISSHLGIEQDEDACLEELSTETDISKVARSLEENTNAK